MINEATLQIYTPIYLIGFVVFVFTFIADLINKKVNSLTWRKYVIDFLYTFLSILLGIVICHVLETAIWVSFVVSICMGLFGSTLLTKILSKEEKITDGVINKILKSDRLINKVTEKIEEKIDSDSNKKPEENNNKK